MQLSALIPDYIIFSFFSFFSSADSLPGTIRGDLCIQVGRNIIHGSDAVESANKEIALWFTEKELVSWTPANSNWVYE